MKMVQILRLVSAGNANVGAEEVNVGLLERRRQGTEPNLQTHLLQSPQLFINEHQ